jgi:hypothetical protein
VVIDDLDFVRMAILPDKTHPPLVVDPDAVLALPICRESLKPVPRRNLEVIEFRGSVHLHELPQRNTLQVLGNRLTSFAPEELLGFFVPEALDHGPILTLGVSSGQAPNATSSPCAHNA